MTCMAHELAAQRGLLAEEDVDVIRGLVKELRAQHPRKILRVVDLGAGSGTTALSVFAEEPNRVLVTTVDLDEVALDYTELAIINTGYRQHWRGVRSDSAWAAATYDSRHGVDLLLVDAGHTRDAVQKDLAAWLPRLLPSGVVWVHDYGRPQDFNIRVRPSPGVREAIDELVREREVETVQVAGLGWAGKRYVEQEESNDNLGTRRPRTTR